jgi:hypothetical protein
MNIVLINPPNHRSDIDDLAPPLGLLMLADVLIDDGAAVAIIDLNLDSCRGTLPKTTEFYPSICEQILAINPELVCFTSMGINSHVALELARLLKHLKPSIVTAFGGPHFSSIAWQLKQQFPWVDYVIVGEGEVSLLSLVRPLRDGERPEFGVITAGSKIQQAVEALAEFLPFLDHGKAGKQVQASLEQLKATSRLVPPMSIPTTTRTKDPFPASSSKAGFNLITV